MPLSTESLDEPSLNLTPMIDIVFLLIIFFMVGARFSEIEQQFDVKLPQADALTPMSQAPDPIVINISRDGSISIGGDVVTRSELKTRLQAARENWSEQAAVIRGDGEAVYQSVMDVVAICHQVKMKNALAFQPVQDSSP